MRPRLALLMAEFKSLRLPSSSIESLPLVIRTDLVLMTKEEAQKHEKEVFTSDNPLEQYYEPDVVALVKRRHDEEHAFDKYR